MRRNHFIVALVFLMFFVLSFLTNILGPIIPDIIDSFHVSLAAAAFLPFSFFLAYGVLSVPAGFLVDRFTEKPVMIASFIAALAGAFSFAIHPTYAIAVTSSVCDRRGNGDAAGRHQSIAPSGRRRGALRIQLGARPVCLRHSIVPEPADLRIHGEQRL